MPTHNTKETELLALIIRIMLSSKREDYYVEDYLKELQDVLDEVDDQVYIRLGEVCGMDEPEVKAKGGLDNINLRLHKIEDSLEKSLNALEYIKEPTPQAEVEGDTKPNIEGTIPSMNYTTDRLTKVSDAIATAISKIRYGQGE